MNFKVTNFNYQANRFNQFYRLDVCLVINTPYNFTTQMCNTLIGTLGSVYATQKQCDVSYVNPFQPNYAYAIKEITYSDDGTQMLICISITNNKYGKVFQSWIKDGKQMDLYFLGLLNYEPNSVPRVLATSFIGK